MPSYRARHKEAQPDRRRRMIQASVAAAGLLLVGSVAAFAAPMFHGHRGTPAAGNPGTMPTVAQAEHRHKKPGQTAGPPPVNNANPNPNCTLIVPANPLTAAGLATPYQLTATNAGNGPCNEANANQSADRKSVV